MHVPDKFLMIYQVNHPATLLGNSLKLDLKFLSAMELLQQGLEQDFRLLERN